jgi:eukaryotic-like serine/threonine-protein kinase
MDGAESTPVLGSVLAGHLVGDRFRLGRLWAWREMNALFQATDLTTGRPAAVKLLVGASPDDARRVDADVRRLRALQLRGLIGHLESSFAGGVLAVAFEWLDGVSLRQRAAVEGLRIGEAVAAIEQVARALAELHAAGFVHRALEPDRIFLCGPDATVRLLDPGHFQTERDGVVRADPRHLSPEELAGGQGPDARSNVFALGSILYECLIGRPAHEGDTVIDVVTRICAGNVVPPSQIDSGIPPALDELVLAMMATNPAQRPRAAEASKALIAAARPTSITTVRARTIVSRLTDERRVITVAFAVPAAGAPSAEQALGRMRTIAASFGARVAPLGERGVVMMGSSALEPLAEAGRLVRCALALEAATGWRIAVVTRPAVLVRGWPLGDALDGAAALGGAAEGVVVDDSTAALLDRRFEVSALAGCFLVAAYRPDAPAVRALGAGDGALVGRARELAHLLSLCDETTEERRPLVATVIGEAGIGKSRLAAEVLAALRARPRPPVILVGRGDPVAAGSPFGIATRALRTALGVSDAAPPEAHRHALADRLGMLGLDEEARAHATRFLGLLLGIPAEDDDHVTLVAARRDAALMSAYLRRAFCDWLRAESRRASLLVFLIEDLHFGDAPSVALLEAALRRLEDVPLQVLAMARPEVTELFPDAWKGCPAHVVRLGELGDDDATLLVRRVLPGSSAELVRRVIGQAGGNPFFLEELARTADSDEPLPRTVLAAVQARLEKLDDGERLLLRAASVFGEVFWPGGALTLLGEDHAPMLEARIGALLEERWIARRPEADLGAEPAYAFRHVLIRIGAYEMLTDVDRPHAHRLAAAWLEWRGASDPLMLPHHWRRAEQTARAIPWYLRAGRHCLDGNDFPAVHRWVEEALACGAQGELRAELMLVAAAAHEWTGDSERRAVAAEEALRLLPPGTAWWFDAFDHALTGRARAGRHDEVKQLLGLLAALPDDRPVLEAEIVALARASGQLALAGFADRGRELFDAAQLRAGQALVIGPAARGWLAWAASWQAMGARDMVGCMVADERAATCFREAGDIRNVCYALGCVGYDQMRLGLYDEAAASLQRALRTAELMDLGIMAAVAAHNLGLATALRGMPREGQVFEERALTLLQSPGTRLYAAAREYLARIHLIAGEATLAEQAARSALDAAARWPSMRALAEATLAQALLAQRRPDEALAAARRATVHGTAEHPDGEGAYLELALGQTLCAAGETDEARAVVERACATLEDTARRIADPALRQSFLAQVVEHQKLFTLREALRG